MPSFISEDLERYVESHSSSEPGLLSALAEETRRATDDPQMMIGHVAGLFLRAMVVASRARRVLEVGTFTGYSTLAMAEGLPDDGIIITCDVDPETTALAKKYWEQSKHGGKIELRLGPALETLEGIEGPIDLAFIDADKQNYINYWEAILPKVRTGGLIVIDNVLWSGRVLDPKEPSDRAIAAFNEHVVRDERVEVVMLPVRDGLTLASKRA
jgi:caffeoyl-CoA O-methyltransferase